jgi:hypothetical protein
MVLPRPLLVVRDTQRAPKGQGAYLAAAILGEKEVNPPLALLESQLYPALS